MWKKLFAILHSAILSWNVRYIFWACEIQSNKLSNCKQRSKYSLERNYKENCHSVIFCNYLTDEVVYELMKHGEEQLYEQTYDCIEQSRLEYNTKIMELQNNNAYI